MSASSSIEELRAEARYARERYDLYRARMYGMRPTSASRLRELERMHEGAKARLRSAELALQPGPARADAATDPSDPQPDRGGGSTGDTESRP